jgi:TolB protein
MPPATVASLVIAPGEDTIAVGQSLQLTAVVRDSAGRVLAERAIIWAVSDSTVATVNSSGVVTGLSVGTVAAIATSDGASDTASLSIDRVPISTEGRVLVFSSSIGVPDRTEGNTTYANIKDIFVSRADGSDRVNLTSHDAHDTEPSWSADGKWIVFTSTRGGNRDLYTMRDDGTRLRRVTTAPEDDGYGRWSPDGTKIVFFSRRVPSGFPPFAPQTLGDLYLIKPDGTSTVNLTNTPQSDEWYPAWSPDGTRIAYVRSDYGPGQFGGMFVTSRHFYVMNADGSDQRVFFEVPADHSPDAISWSADGKRIAFSVLDRVSAPFFSDFLIFVANADGSNPKQLSHPDANDRYPAWSPDGTRLLFSSGCCGEGWGFDMTGISTMNADGSGSYVTVEAQNGRRALTESPAAWRIP